MGRALVDNYTIVWCVPLMDAGPSSLQLGLVREGFLEEVAPKLQLDC